MKKLAMIDKFLLILTGFSILLFYFLADVIFSTIVSKEWVDFIIGSIAYIVILLYGTFAVGDFKHVEKKKVFLFQSLFYLLTVGVAYIIFSYEVLPMPRSHHVYIIAVVILSTCSVILLDYCVKHCKFFHNNRNNKKKK